MTRDAWRSLAAFASGLVFGAGLLVSGMTRPAKVLAFLDPLGAWDPSLAFVMLGAVGVYAAAVRWGSRGPAPALGPVFSVVPRRKVDVRLLLGAGIFGVGWGLGGYCPGPSLVALGSGAAGVLLFVGCMLLGSLLASLFEGLPSAREPRDRAALQS